MPSTPAWARRGGQWLLRALVRHPRVPQALKAAVAAAAAWTVVQPFPGIADEYPYYAPLGAVIAVSTTVAGSVRASAQGVLAILLGAAVARAVDLVVPVSWAALAVAVLVGSLLAGWHRLGTMAAWLPTSVIFVLILGDGDPLGFIVAYGGLTLLGAAIGVGINLAFPPLHLTASLATLKHCRGILADQLVDLAEGLRFESAPSRQDWRERERAIEPVVAEVRAMVGQVAEAMRANWRAKARQEEAERQYRQAQALGQLSFLVEDIRSLLVNAEHAERSRVALGPSLRPPAAEALDRMAQMLRSVQDSSAGLEQVEAADFSLRHLSDVILRERERTGDDMFEAGSLVVSLRRAIESLVPASLADRLPSG